MALHAPRECAYFSPRKVTKQRRILTLHQHSKYRLIWNINQLTFAANTISRAFLISLGSWPRNEQIARKMFRASYKVACFSDTRTLIFCPGVQSFPSSELFSMRFVRKFVRAAKSLHRSQRSSFYYKVPDSWRGKNAFYTAIIQSLIQNTLDPL